MDTHSAGFAELERAFEQATLQLNHDGRVSAISKYDTIPTNRAQPAAVPSKRDSDPPLVSPLRDDELVSLDVRITPPPDHHPGLRRHHSGLPPTPPTMTNSDVAESKPDRSMSPLPLFADRVRNALESQKSGFSTPIAAESLSPPTPDPSPRAVLPTLQIPRPLLVHQISTQSQAESFITATEGRSAHDSTSKVDLRTEAWDEPDDHRFLSTPKPKHIAAFDGADVLGLSDQSDRGEARTKTYQTESDTDGERVRTKTYQLESDSDMERPMLHDASDSHDTADETPTSPVARKVLDHRAAYQRLWKPFQPGDAIKRPDAALLYGSLASRKLPVGLNRTKSPPRREEDEESCRNAENPVLAESPHTVKVASPRPDPQPEPELAPASASDPAPESTLESSPTLESILEPAAQPAGEVAPDLAHNTPTPQDTDMPSGFSNSLRDFAPLEAPPDPTPPTTAQKESLEENNIVYRLIQEENAKRHSGISDGSVQAVVIPVADQKRTLRHTPKRASLRGDATVEVNSKRSSPEGDHTLRHKRASVGGEAGSISKGGITPRDTNSSRRKTSTPLGRTNPSPASNASPSARLSRSQRRYAATGANEEDVVARAEDAILSARISRFAPGENGFDYWSSIPDLAPSEQESDHEVPGSATLSKLPSFQPRKLRRSLRERGLDRHGSDARPQSHDGSTIPNTTQLPTLRRSSQEKRLDKNNDVRRTSFGHVEHTTPQSAATRLVSDLDGLPREGRDTREPTTTQGRHVSPDWSFHTAASPRRKSFDPRHLHPLGTPYSVSQFSDRTEAEVLEARGVELFPHNNESLLIVQQASQAISRPIQPHVVGHDEAQQTDQLSPSEPPIFEAYVEAANDTSSEIDWPKYAVDSPLTNPRTAPEPPVIKFIPPTPNEELERTLDVSSNTTNEPRKGMQRRLSLSQRVRRYSESLIQPMPFGRNGSLRRQESKRSTTMPEVRPTYLSSFWQPRDFWEEYDSDDESEDYEPLPAGGDTSNVVAQPRTLFPRKMSVRMSGFRGTGGFHIGNSLGLERHGTNNRRHYVRKRTSEELLRRMADSRRRRTFTVPFSHGTRVEYVGFTGLGTRLRAIKEQRQAKALEKRREKLRQKIGTRLYHDA